MFLLLANDDGYLSSGMRFLRAALAPEVDRVAVFAPDRDCSAASHSLTLTRPLTVTPHDKDIWSVDGSPADCVHLALGGYLPTFPDMVIAGINHGANMGSDVMYSGTVAAAYEGHNLGLPVLAVSNVNFQPQHLESSARVVVDIFRKLRFSPLPKDLFLNINIPDLPYGDIKGWRATVLGKRHPAEKMTPANDPRGRKSYWIGIAGGVMSNGEETDFHAVANGYVSITPLQFDLTAHGRLATLQTWLEGGK